jgi:helix-turn-helix protein
MADNQEQLYPVGEILKWMRWVLDDRVLTWGEKCAAIRVILHLNSWTGECYPSVETIASELGMSSRGVGKALKAVQARGFLDWPPNKGGTGRSNDYRPTTPTPNGGSVFDVAQPRTTVHSSKVVRQANPEQNGREPRTGVYPNPEQNDTEPRTTVQRNGSLMVKENGSLNDHALASLAAPPTKEVKQESKQTSDEASKPEARAILERIENGIAYVKCTDHGARLRVIEQYDQLLARIKSECSEEQVNKISAYIGRTRLAVS